MAASYSSGALEDSEGDLSANPVIASSPVASQGPSLPLDNAPDVETVAEVSSDRPEDNVDTLTAEQKKGEDTQEEEEQIGAPNDDASRTDKVQQDNEDVLGGDDDDDDFGDFDTAGEAPLHTEAPLPPPTNTGLLPVNAAEEARIADLLSSRRFLVDSVILQAYGPLLTQAFPLVAPLPLNTTASILETSSPSRSAHSKDEEGASSRNGLIWAVQVPSKTLSHKGTTEPGSNTLYTPNPELCSSQSSTWVELYQRLSQDTVFSESGSRFRWRRSAIRRAFLQSLNLDVAAVEGSSKSRVDLVQTPLSAAPKASSGFPSSVTPQSLKLDDRERDLLDAKKLCETTEDDLRRKTPEELQEYIQLLHLYHQKMQEQANYWLDAKEQLIMDAETHNKVIASLVQYAQQQQQAPKASSAAQNSKKKRGIK